MPLERLPRHAPESVPESRDTSLPHGREIRPQNDDDHSSRTHLAPRTSRDPCKTCDVCGQSFRWPHDLRRHERLHSPQELKFVCGGRCGKTECGKAYTRRDQIRRHLGGLPPDTNRDGTSLARREGKRHECPHCPQELSTRYRLVEHLRSHTDERPFACPICPRAYKYLRDLTKHTKQCLPPAQLSHEQNMAQNTPVASGTGISESFPVCQGEDLTSTVTRRGTLGHHLGDFFNIPLNFPPHWREETSGSQPSKGHETQQSPAQNTTNDNQSSRTHLAPRTNRGPRNQGKACDFCGRLFERVPDCLRHEKSHRPEELKFVCDGGCGKTGCGKAYYRRDVLLLHLSSSRDQDGTSLARHEICHTAEGLRCPYCPLRPSTTSSLAEHLRSHIHARPFACAICSHAYKQKRDLQKHMKRCLPPAQLPHQQNMAQNTPVASDTGISESFPVCQGDDLVSIVGTHNDHVDTENHSDGLISYPPMATESFLVQHPPMPTAPTDGTTQGFYGDSLPIQTWPAGEFFYTNPWAGPFLAPPISVTTQQGMPADQPENQEEGHLETVYFNTSWVRI